MLAIALSDKYLISTHGQVHRCTCHARTEIVKHILHLTCPNSNRKAHFLEPGRSWVLFIVCLLYMLYALCFLNVLSCCRASLDFIMSLAPQAVLQVPVHASYIHRCLIFTQRQVHLCAWHLRTRTFSLTEHGEHRCRQN